MKKFLSLGLILVLCAVCLAGCGKKDRLLFKKGLSKYIELGDFEGITVDTSSDEFEKMYDDILSEDSKAFVSYETVTEGKVKDGDIANITFVGKKDGVAFEGGSGTTDLTIGSGQFIDGFEEGLIGVEIGKTVDLNLTFPNPYPNNPDLAGKPVIFTVTVNSIKAAVNATNETVAKELGFKDETEYLNDVRVRAIKNYLFVQISKSSKIKDYPKDDLNYILEQYKKSMNVESDAEFEQMLSYYYGSTKEKFIEESLKPQLDDMMVIYAVLDEAKLEVTSSDVDNEAREMAAEVDDGSTAGDMKDKYGSYYIEYLVASEKALEYMYEKANVK